MATKPKISVPMELPGNPNNKRQQPKPEKQKKLIKGAVIKKENNVHKLARSFFQEDVENIKEYVIFDVVVPEVKNTLLDVFEMMMFGQTRGRRSTRGGRTSGGVINNTHTDYTRGGRSAKKVSNINRRTVNKFDDLIIENRGDAEIVLDALIDQIESYGFVSVADFYDMIDVNSNHTDQKYGWSSLGKAQIIELPRREGFVLDLPPTRVLD